VIGSSLLSQERLLAVSSGCNLTPMLRYRKEYGTHELRKKRLKRRATDHPRLRNAGSVKDRRYQAGVKRPRICGLTCHLSQID